MTTPIRLLIVDDSSFLRYTIARQLSADPDIVVVGSAHNGLDALAKIPALKPDVVTLDVDMPSTDSLTLLQRLMADYPTPVVMLSSPTQDGAQTTVQALMGGAVDFVMKPTSITKIGTVIQELAIKVKIAAHMPIFTSITEKREFETQPSRLPVSPNKAKSGLHPLQQGDPVIVIATTTGGARALQEVMTKLPADLAAAIIVIQDMSAEFIRLFAKQLNEISPLTVREATDGDHLARGLVLITPSNAQLRLKGNELALDPPTHQHHFHAAVDISMEAIVEAHKSAVIGVFLTGAGSDGVEGARCIKAAGGKVIAEYGATSVVYDMPGNVIEAGLADDVTPLPRIASSLVKLMENGRSKT